MDIKSDTSCPKEICPYCHGSGKLKAMQILQWKWFSKVIAHIPK